MVARPEQHEHLADHVGRSSMYGSLVQSVGPEAHVDRGVGRVAAVVAHHEDVARRASGPTVQSHCGARRHRPVAVGAAESGRTCFSSSGCPLTSSRPLLVAAVDDVAGDADHPLHQVAAGRVEPDLGQHLGDVVGGAGRLLAAEPAARVLEDHDVPALRGAAEPVRRLLDQDPVVLDQARLHRLRRDVEGLDEQRLDDDRQHQRDAEQQDRLLPDRQVLLLAGPLPAGTDDDRDADSSDRRRTSGRGLRRSRAEANAGGLRDPLRPRGAP